MRITSLCSFTGIRVSFFSAVVAAKYTTKNKAQKAKKNQGKPKKKQSKGKKNEERSWPLSKQERIGALGYFLVNLCYRYLLRLHWSSSQCRSKKMERADASSPWGSWKGSDGSRLPANGGHFQLATAGIERGWAQATGSLVHGLIRLRCRLLYLVVITSNSYQLVKLFENRIRPQILQTSTNSCQS